MLAFMHIRKTAGSTIESILRASLGLRHCGVRVRRSRRPYPVLGADEVARCRWIYRRLLSISGHGVVPFTDLAALAPEVRYYTFLREPLERCAAEYQFRLRHGGLNQPFEKWITTNRARNRQVRQFCGSESFEHARQLLQRHVGFVGLVERFHESLVMWAHWCKPVPLDIRYRKKNVAACNHIKLSLLSNLETRRMLIEANRADLQLYEYACDAIFPRQMRDYGARLSMDVQAFEAFNLPPAAYPRQLPELMVRELLYKPLAPWLSNRADAVAAPLSRHRLVASASTRAA